MKITTRPWPGNGRSHPPLWDVLIDGAPIGSTDHDATSDGRVLKMGARFLPIYDPAPFGCWGSCATRKDAAAAVAARHASRTARQGVTR